MPLCPFNMQGPSTASLGSRLNAASYYDVCSPHEIPHSSRAELTSGVIQIIQTICVPVTSLMMVNSLRVENAKLHFFFFSPNFKLFILFWGIEAFLVTQTVKNPPAMRETQVQPLGREDLLEKEWQVTLVFLLGESHGQRSLVGYSPWRCKESDMTEGLTHH